MGDITYIRSYEGWCYLACVLDLGSREIVGYATSRTPDTALTKKALDITREALNQPPKYGPQKVGFEADTDNGADPRNEVQSKAVGIAAAQLEKEVSTPGLRRPEAVEAMGLGFEYGLAGVASTRS